MLPTKGKLLALDLGSKRTGVSVSDNGQQVAFLRNEIHHENNEDLFRQLAELLEGETIVGLVVGYPLKLNGEKSPQTEKTEIQIQAIQEQFNLPMATVDERYTSQEAKTPKMKVVDSRSAQILLENFLFSQHRKSG